MGFAAFPGVGPKKFAALVNAFGSAQQAWQASENDLRDVLGNALTEKFLAFRLAFSLEEYLRKLENARIQFITIDDDAYPELLKKLPNPPIVLFAKGNISLLYSPHMIAVVGTRKVTSYGRSVTELLTKQLTEQQVVIVSGLAIGIDSIAHTTAVNNQGKTIAVLGCGVDCCTPSSNQKVYNEILEKDGLIVSESAFGAASSKGMFPSRNRIIAGLSHGVLVTEGAEDSGALITAKYAKELDRMVFAVPGHITSSLSHGPLKLMQDGAVIVSSTQDILRKLNIDKSTYNKITTIETNDPVERSILSQLTHEDMHFDELVKKIKLDSSHLAGILSIMELKGYVQVGKEGKYIFNAK